MKLKMSITTKVLVPFLFIGIIPFSVLGLLSLRESTRALEHQTFNEFKSVRDIKKTEIERYFAERESDLGVLTEMVETMREEAFARLMAVQQIKTAQIEEFFEDTRNDIASLSASGDVKRVFETLRQYHQETGVSAEGAFPVSAPAYQTLYDANTAFLTNYMNTKGYYDIYIICAAHGHVMFSCAREKDMGTNLGHGPDKDSRLAQLWRKVVETKDIAVVDFSPYAPSDGQQSAFIGAPIMDGDRILGVLAFNIPSDPINLIAQRRDGMGRTGETYLVGRTPEGISLRSDMKTDGEGKYMIGITAPNAKADYIKQALEGSGGQGLFTDYRGRLIAAAYNGLKLSGLSWAIISQIDLEEFAAPKDEGEKEDFYAHYIKKYGYYDLFLIHPQGKVFYTVTHEKDYGSNLINGDYKNTNLGKLFQKVLSTKAYGVSDFEPYAPSNGEPAAFVAQPILHQGAVQLVVALQLSLDSINKMMTQREGMGETGETYLIGQDHLMRSDSFLDPQNHSVRASFADPGKGSVKTEAADLALGGASGEKIIIDYNGHPVLSAYTPIQIKGLNWALLAEIDEAEAFAAINTMKRYIWIVGLIGLAAITVVGILITRSLTGPIKRMVSMITSIADTNDLTKRLETESTDELGDLGNTINKFLENLHEVVSVLRQQSHQLSAASTELTAVSENMAAAAEEMASQAEGVRQNSADTLSKVMNVASATDQLSSSVTTMASGVEEMTASISEIAGSASTSASTAAEAASHAVSTGELVNELKGGAKEIERVVEVILDIADQTKLLALNASIEAARAGAAGKGFAVVAGEVKELAGLTGKSTNEIRQKIENIQHSSSISSEAIARIVKVIHSVNEYAQGIAAAVEQQSSTINEFSQNISQIAMVAENVAENTNGVAAVNRETVDAIQSLSQVVQNTAIGVTQVSSSAQELSKMAEGMQQLVNRFTI